MAVTDHDGIVPLIKLFPGEILHFPYQGRRRVAQVILAETGTDGGRLPEDRRRQGGLEFPEETAPEKPPEPEVGPVVPVDGVPVGDVKKLAVQADAEIPGNDDEAPPAEKVLEKEVVVPLEIVNRHAFFPKRQETVHEGTERGVEPVAPGKPEIEEIPHQEEMIVTAAEVPEKGKEHLRCC